MPPWHVQENKWRAARYGLDAEIILDAAANERLVTDDLDDLLDPARAGRGAARRAPTSCARSTTSPARGASYQRQREVAPSAPAATWSRWSTRWCASSTSAPTPRCHPGTRGPGPTGYDLRTMARTRRRARLQRRRRGPAAGRGHPGGPRARRRARRGLLTAGEVVAPPRASATPRTRRRPARRSTSGSRRRSPSRTPTPRRPPRASTSAARSATARAGRLVDEDEGLGPDVEKDLVGEDVGIDGAGASAEEAAVHVIDDGARASAYAEGAAPVGRASARRAAVRTRARPRGGHAPRCR